MNRTEMKIMAIDKPDLDQQVRKIAQNNPSKRVTCVKIDELPLVATSPYPMRTILPRPTLAAVIELYELE